MEWLFPSVVATLAGTLVLAGTYLYLYRFDRQHFLLIWGLGWLVSAFRFVFMLLFLAGFFGEFKSVFLIANQLCTLVSGVLLLHGTFAFINRPTPKPWYFLATAAAIWIIASSYLQLPFLWLTLPTYIFIGIIYCWTGVVFLNYSPLKEGGKTLTGWTFILWGLHKMDYPLLRPVTWFAPWGYLLGATMEIVVAMGMLLTYFNQSRAELQNSRDKLQKSENRFRDLAENSTDWIWEFDKDELFTYTSPRIKDLLGYTQEEVLGKSVFDLIFPPDREQVRKAFALIKEQRAPFSNLLNVNQHKNGTKVILESSGVPISDSEGNFLGYRGIDRDTTERKKMEEKLNQAQKMESIGTLAGGIAHDFNNILSAIMGYTELALGDINNPDRLQQELNEVLHGTNRAKELVKQILTFSRRHDQNILPVQIQSITSEALKLLRSSIPSTIEIKPVIDKSCGPILADPTQIHQVIMNLSTNAYHAMREAGGTLTVSLQQVVLSSSDISSKVNLRPGPYLKLQISDTGVGMTKEVQNRIFEPYFTTKGTGEGTGLGLAVVHGIIKSLQGDISVYSEPAKGTTFTIYLPVAQTKPESGLEEEMSALLPQTGSEHILLVDDDEAIVTLNKSLLENLGYKVTASTSSLDTLWTFQQSPDSFDLLISDMTMPQMTGAELAEKILAIRPGIPIILCSGYSDLINEERAKAIGIREYVMKPVNKKEFAATIRKVLNVA
jgi:PAS domain S-box-containing protein